MKFTFKIIKSDRGYISFVKRSVYAVSNDSRCWERQVFNGEKNVKELDADNILPTPAQPERVEYKDDGQPIPDDGYWHTVREQTHTPIKTAWFIQ